MEERCGTKEANMRSMCSNAMENTTRATADGCKTPHFTEDEIKQKFMLAYNEAMTDKQRIINDTKEVIALLSDTTEIEK